MYRHENVGALIETLAGKKFPVKRVGLITRKMSSLFATLILMLPRSLCQVAVVANFAQKAAAFALN
jgi:hypothetical protein